jgi:hypothetical protein
MPSFRVVSSLIGVATIVACSAQPLTRPHTPLDVSAEPLRSDFNRDRNAVRLVVLASPT